MISILHKFVGENLVFTADDDKEPIAVLTAHFDEEYIYITDISGDPFLSDGLVRAAMNYADRHGVTKCSFETLPDSVLERIIALGFVQKDNKVIDNIDNFFTFHKSCKK